MSWIKNIALVLTSVIITVIAAELVLRLVFPEKIDTADVFDHSDPSMPRHAMGSFVDQIRGTTATFENNGFRYIPWSCSKTQNIKRVLLVGDSNIAGLYLDDSETLGAQLTKLTLETTNCLQVDSFGVSGFGPDQTFGAIKYFVEKEDYDVVIFHIFADNDLGDIVRNNEFHNGVLIDDGYCYPQKPLFEKWLVFKALRKAISVFTGKNVGYGEAVSSKIKKDNCEIVGRPVGSDEAEFLSNRALLDKQLYKNGLRQIYVDDRYDIEFACRSDTELISYVSAALKLISGEMKSLSATKQFDLIYLIQPSELDVTRNNPSISDSIRKSCEEGYDPKNLSNYFTTTLEGGNIVSLFQEFNGCTECYFTELERPGDNHWSPYGVRRAAEIILNSVESDSPGGTDVMNDSHPR